MMDEPKACTTCQFHHFESVFDSGIHLCTVRHALPDDIDDERTPSEREQSEAAFIGWNCDRCRRMGELCGPAGKLWSARP
jgi:hypothetical protein